MALIVEDGTGRTDAESFISVGYADTYHAARGNDAWAASTATEAKKEEALRRASTFLSDSFAWQGFPINNRDQLLEWPRSGVLDKHGYAVDNDSVPREIERATAEVALRELATPGVMTPDYTPHGRQKISKVGPIMVEYDLSRLDAEGARPVLLILRDLIGPLLSAKGQTSSLSGETVRV